MKWAKWFLVYLNILTQSIAITDSMFNFGNFLTKNAITFDQNEIERKKKKSRRHEILLRIQLRMSNKKRQNHKKKIQLFSQFFFKHCNFSKKVQIFRKKRDIFPDSRVSFRHFEYLFACLGLIVKLLINYLQHHIEFTKNYENHVNFKFWDPLAAKSWPPIKKTFCHTVLNYFLGKSP